MTETELTKVEDDAKATLAHVDEVIQSDALKTKASISGWAKAHTSWLIGLACLVVGLVVGYWLHHPHA